MTRFGWLAFLIPSLLWAQVDVRFDDATGPEGFDLVDSLGACAIVVDACDAEVVRIAAEILAADLQRVTGQPALLTTPGTATDRPRLLLGTLGRHSEIDRLVAEGILNVDGLRGGWERFLIQQVDSAGQPRRLIVVGSDRRGTAYGAVTLSEAIGVSPWVWWADVPTPRHERIRLVTPRTLSPTPSVKYRGIFLNDEDWGLQPWAAEHWDTDIRDIGPKTYAKIFELMLRLKANTLWPAMHPCTQAFNLYPENKLVADRYAIVMGSSHCEPMLCNNVTEWDKQTMGDWNYETNRERILDYWRRRVQSNGRFENIYTVGMRGIHDSGIPGGGTDLDKRDRLARIIRDQRVLLRQYVNPVVEQVPQIFCPYKEVLKIYQLGLPVPDDITLVWPDDNHGYVRRVSTPQERQRSGRAGVYYHFSYWGAPEDYLWLGSTSPALTSYEMTKAYACGADRIWIFNVGDIKPIEKEMEFGLRLAYDINSYPPERAMTFLNDWAARTFGARWAEPIAAVLRTYYRLAAGAKPEHSDRVRFSKAEQIERLAAYERIAAEAEELYGQVDPAARDAFFQLVLYPVKGAALMNAKQIYRDWGQIDRAQAAYDEIQSLTHIYNHDIAGGKWNRMMDASPRKRPVFARPQAGSGPSAQTGHWPEDLVAEIPLDSAVLSGQMVREAGTLVARAPTLQAQDSLSRATFLLDDLPARPATLYFYARCPDDKHDSWYVRWNDEQIVSNDQPTGARYRWLKIMDVTVADRSNRLVIVQREPGTEIRRIVLVRPGTVPPEVELAATVVWAADQATWRQNGSVGRWTRVEGLGIEEAAMAVLPVEWPALTLEQVASAPRLEFTWTGAAPACVVEARFLPTHALTDGLELRYAVQVDDGPLASFDLNAAEWSAEWSQNVLRGYAAGQSRHRLAEGNQHVVRLFVLSPGMAVSQVRVTEETIP